MSFDVCHDCGGSTDWGVAVRLALAWVLPTVLWVLYQQLPKGLASPVIALMLGWAAAGAALYSAFDLGMVDVEEPVQREILTLTLEGGIVSVLSVRLVRWLRKRQGRWVSDDGAA